MALKRAWLALASLALPAMAAERRALLVEHCDYGDGLVSNEYAYSNPESEGARSPLWEVTSGSLFGSDGTCWSGKPDGKAPNRKSSRHTGSSVFRMNSRQNFGDVEVSFALLNQGLSTSRRTPAVDWDGVHIFLRHQSQFNLYYASINRRDDQVLIKKKVPGGPSNGGTYYTLSSSESYKVPYGVWQKVAATVQNDPPGSVAIKLYADGKLLVSAVDNGSVGGPPILAPGKVGLRGDNCDFKFDDFTVRALEPAAKTPLASSPR